MKKIYLPVAVALLNLTFLSTAFGLALETLDASTMNKKQIEQKYEENKKKIAESPSSPQEKEDLSKKNDQNYEAAQQNLEMYGFKFGIGLLGSHFHGKSRVVATSVQNGIVSIDEGDNNILGAVFETHNFFGHITGPLYWGWFLGVQTTNDKIVESAIAGLMLATKYKNNPTDGGSFNIGFGFIMDPNARVLADGFEAGMPLPAGEQGVRTKKVTKTGYGVVISYGF
ncbi:MAG TPA: hypothetical protein VL197_01590 [Nitrospirota bacterium]|nr:hypothetical protein [Nitrospirota bacterium]